MTTKVNSPPLDILIRTSGVRRLSDFLLWQVSPILDDRTTQVLTPSDSAPITRRFILLILSGLTWACLIFSL